MASFNPKSSYDIVQKDFPIEDFYKYKDEFVTRPPYQRKNVWSKKKKQDLLDSLFRRYYIPRIVVREIRLDKETTVNEIIDGQQRISTVQEFFDDEIRLPDALGEINRELAGSTYAQLSSDVRRFIDRELLFTADIVKNIDDPHNKEHQEVATQIFWRLQQGESLNYMEIAHSQLSSLARNFVVKYSDDQRFDYQRYQPLDDNPDKHPFFTIISRDNNRMQHLALLTRLLILEEAAGPTDIKNVNIGDYISQHKRNDGINNWEMDKQPHAKTLLRNLTAFHEAFADDPMLDELSGVKELKDEYFIISAYLLLRHLVAHYVFDKKEKRLFREFIVYFHQLWSGIKREKANLNQNPNSVDILGFSENRQQSANEIAIRERILRQMYFEYLNDQGEDMLTIDDRRAFNESERIMIYRMNDGYCQECLKEGKPERECRVSWKEYQADHIFPHSKGGQTSIDNAQLLCAIHNNKKGAQVP
jgi:hypothetical protein